MLLHQVDARARSLNVAAPCRRYRNPVAFGLAKIVRGRVGRTILFDERFHHVVERLEQLGMIGRSPTAEGKDVVARSRLGLGLLGQQQLVALRGDVVDLDFDPLLCCPLLDEGRTGGVGRRDPMIPQTHREFARGMCPADVGHGNHDTGGCTGGKKAASRRASRAHHEFSLLDGSSERAAVVVMGRTVRSHPRAHSASRRYQS